MTFRSLYTIGYEGASPRNFLGTLQFAEIQLLIDIRDRAQSRRRGFSKSHLQENLAAGGIEYCHIRALGDPKEGRDAARSGDWERFFEIYSSVIAKPDAQQALDKITDLLKSANVCLLCYERDQRTCHRKIVSDILQDRLGVKPTHLGVQDIEPICTTNRRVRHLGQGATTSIKQAI